MGVYGDLLKLNQAPKSVPSSAPKPDQKAPTDVVPPISKNQPVTALASEFPPVKPSQTVSRNHDTVIPRNHGIKTPRNHDTMIQTIRTAVKQFGKEAATHRFTPDEKKAVAEVVFAYRNRGIKTSENEIARTGVNFLIEDYKLNGEKSILDQVLKALNQ